MHISNYMLHIPYYISKTLEIYLSVPRLQAVVQQLAASLWTKISLWLLRLRVCYKSRFKSPIKVLLELELFLRAERKGFLRVGCTG